MQKTRKQSHSTDTPGAAIIVLTIVLLGGTATLFYISSDREAIERAIERKAVNAKVIQY